jgi:D-3-phosphoglycerate dehydrogenase
MGEIGAAVADRARGFEMPVVAWSRSLTPEKADELGVARASSPEEVARRSDVVSVHLALTPETKGLVGEAVLSAMRQGALFLNTSRAEVVDEAALLRAIEERGVRAGLDVFGGEPTGKDGAFDHPLAKHPHVVGTHHIGASTDQAQEAIAAETVRVIRSFKETGRVPNVVNLARRTPATHMLVVRHRDRPGVLAHVFNHLRQANLNVQETENIVFEGAEAAVARINLDGEPTASLCTQIKSESADVLDLQLVTL